MYRRSGTPDAIAAERKRDDRRCMGSGVMAAFVHCAVTRGIPVLTNAPAVDLHVEAQRASSRVVGS